MTATPSASPAPISGIRAFARRHPLLTFFVLAYGVTWLLWTPIVVGGLPAFGATTHAPSLYVMPGIAIGVTGVAFAVTALIDGKAGVVALLRRLGSWRHGVQWWMVAIALLPLSTVIVTLLLGASDAGASLSLGSFALYPASYLAHFVFGPLFEETGWRGFALPRMQKRFGPTRGTLLLALLWAVWHFFLYAPVWFAGGFADGVVGILFFSVTVVAMTFSFTWLSNNTRGSLLLCILMHGSVDGTVTYFQRVGDAKIISPDTVGILDGVGATAAYILLAAIILICTRGNLSYRRYVAETSAAALPGSTTGTRRSSAADRSARAGSPGRAVGRDSSRPPEGRVQPLG